MLVLLVGSPHALAAARPLTAEPLATCGPLVDLTAVVPPAPLEVVVDGANLERIESLTHPRSLTAFEANVRDRPEQRLDPRAAALLEREVTELERLREMTPVDASDYSSVLYRLSRRHAELGRVAAHDLRSAAERAKWLRSLGATQQAAALAAAGERSRALARLSYRGLVRYGEAWLGTAVASPPAERAEVLLEIGLAHELVGDETRARRAYERLLMVAPRPALQLEARLALAELGFVAAESDATRWPAVETAYRELEQRSPRSSRRGAYLRYKLGHALWHQGRLDEALRDMVALAAEGARPVSEPADAVADAVEADVLLLFALGGDPAAARATLARLAQGPEHLDRLLTELGALYVETASGDRAFVLHRTLARQAPAPNACRHLAAAVAAGLDGDLPRREVAGAVAELLDVAGRLAPSSEVPADRDPCGALAVALGSEAALRWQADATRSAEGDAATGAARLDGLDDLLGQLVARFGPDDFEHASFPRIARASWPTHESLRRARAALARSEGDLLRCGELYAELERHEADAYRRAEAIAASAACYAGYLTTEPTRLSDDTMRAAHDVFERYRCRVRRPAVGSPRRERHAEIELAGARLLGTDGPSAASVAALRTVAIELGDTAAGLLASELYPRRLRELAAIEGPPAGRARAQALEDVAHLAALRCGGPRGAANELGAQDSGACDEIGRLGRLLTEWSADDSYRACVSPDAPRLDGCATAAERYATLWRDPLRARCRAGDADCAGAARPLARGADAADRAGLPALALALLGDLVDPRFGLGDTAEARSAPWGIARAHHALGARPLAAGWYEQFARAQPEHESAPTALATALLLRLEEGATADLLRIRQSYEARLRGRRPDLDAEVDLGLGAWLAGRDAWVEAVAVLRDALRAAEQADRLDLQLQAHALLARAARRTGQSALANATAAAGCSAWPRALERLDELAAQSLHPADRPARRRQLLDAAAELLTGCADLERDADRPAPMPSYRGAPSRTALERFVTAELGPWVAARRQRIERLTRSYQRVLGLPSPGADASRLGAARGAVARLWLELADDLRAAEHPGGWNQLGAVPGSEPPVLWAELRAGYHELVRTHALEIRPSTVAACRAAVTPRRGVASHPDSRLDGPAGCEAVVGP